MLLDDNKLEQMLCTVCHKYLSVFPIKIHGDNQVITCGRCSKKNDEGEESLYEIVTRQFLFKCVNRYEGCRALLKPEDVKKHEEKCIGSYFVCPKCEDGFAKSVSELIWHFKTQHSENFLKKNSFNLNLFRKKDTFLYIKGEFIFIIYYQYEAESKLLNISAISLTTYALCPTQHFIIMAGTVQKCTDVKPCQTLNEFKDFCYKINLDNISADLFTIIFELKITAISSNVMLEDPTKCVVITRDSKFLTQDHQIINSLCYNCNKMIGIDIYRCVLKLHSLCKDCNVWCGFCECIVSDKKVVISNLDKTLLFPCDYCGKNFSDIKYHQMNCDNNIKTCPICFMNIKFKLLTSHFKLHETVSFQFSLSFDNLFVCKNTLYFLLNERFIRLNWEQHQNTVHQNSRYYRHQSPNLLVSFDFHFDIQNNVDNAKLLLIYEDKVLNNNSITNISLDEVQKYKLCLHFPNK